MYKGENMNYVLIFAGGTGKRMNSNGTPKQFLIAHGKPVIIHTLEKFENNDNIDGIVISCYKPGIEELTSMIIKYKITKVIDIVPGGNSGQESIYNGLVSLRKFAKDQDIVLVHDGVRPVINTELINSNIECTKKYGSSITVSPSIETIALLENGTVKEIEDRNACFYAKAPQTFNFLELFTAHNRAIEENLSSFIDSSSLMKHYGYTLHVTKCESTNIKITTPFDYILFKAMLDVAENSQIKLD